MVLIMPCLTSSLVYMAYAQPSVGLVYPLVALEQFGYSLGFTVFTVLPDVYYRQRDTRHPTTPSPPE